VLCTVTDRLTSAVLASEPRRCRILANFGVGYNHIDIAEATRRGLVVSNTPGVLTETTADLAMALT
jgi:lactate dehydrogenase-like 2-hydroxyacid dehydrogenase